MRAWATVPDRTQSALDRRVPTTGNLETCETRAQGSNAAPPAIRFDFSVRVRRGAAPPRTPPRVAGAW